MDYPNFKASGSTLASSIVNQNWGEIRSIATDEQIQKFFIGSVFKTLSSLIYDRIFKYAPDLDSELFNILVVYLDKVDSRYKSRFFKRGQLINSELEKLYEKIYNEVLNSFDFTAILFQYAKICPEKNNLFIVEFNNDSKIDSPKVNDVSLDLVEFNIREKVIISYPNLVKESHNYDFQSSTLLNLSDSMLRKDPDFQKNLIKYLDYMHPFLSKVPYLTLIPLWLGPNLNPVSIGSILITSSRVLMIEELRELIRITRENLSPIRTYEFFSDIIKHSKKSAVAAIMSRNMSHNIGSHILSTIKNELKVSEKVDDSSDPSKEVEYEINAKVRTNSYLNGISWLINYLQERQDFIATVSGFEYHTMVPLSFKEFIFDGFLPDKKFERHKSLPELEIQNHILSNIAISENLVREKIVIKFGEFDGITNSDSDKYFALLRKLVVNIPAGILGRQAIYSILENIIRNSAKHGEISDKLEIKIDCPHLKLNENNDIELNDDHFLSINGRNGILTYEYNTDEYFLVSINDNSSISDEDLLKVRIGIEDELVNSKGEMNQEYKGLKEIKISAGWLRGIQPDLLDNNLNDPPILIADKNKNGSLVYYFFLKKSKELLVILSSESINKLRLAGVPIDDLHNYGLDVVNFDSVRFWTRMNHQLNLIEESISPDLLSKISLNNRRLMMDFDSIEEIFIKKTDDSMPSNRKIMLEQYTNLCLNDFWDKWLDFLYDKSELLNSNIYIIDDYVLQPELTKSDNCSLNNFIYLGSEPQDIKRASPIPRILIKKHNDTNKDFKEFITNSDLKEYVKNLEFLEGISGGNSTDLFYRKLHKSKLQYYKLMESICAKAIILDERIWNKVTEININEIFYYNFLEKDEKKLRIILDVCVEILDLKEFKISSLNNSNKSEILKNFKTELETRSEGYNLPLIEEFMQLDFSADRIITFLNDRLKRVKENIKSKIYFKKGFTIVNIYYDTKNQIFYFYDTFLNKHSEFSIIKKDDMDFDLTTFSMISVHQGILDKLHDKSRLKCEELFNRISKNGNSKMIKAIHSGRSKPASLPKNTSFIPYASLENSFLDSKITFTSLIFNSRS